MYEIKSFEIFQTAWVMAVFNMIIAEIFGILIALAALVRGDPGRAMFAIFLYPIIWGTVTLISYALLCRLYNEIASRVGGIAVNLSLRTPESN